MPESRHGLVGPARLWKMKQGFQISYLRGAGLKPSHNLFDIGCGTMRGGVPLVRYLDRGGYVGCEVRPLVLAEGLKEISDQKLDNKGATLIFCDDLARLDLERRFDFVWAFSVLFHMTDQIVNDCLAFVSRQLSEVGTFHANVNLGARGEGRWMQFPVTRRPLEFYEGLAEKNGLCVEVVGTLSELGHVSGDTASDAQAMLRFDPAN